MFTSTNHNKDFFPRARRRQLNHQYREETAADKKADIISRDPAAHKIHTIFPM